jgi:hypothetical protein
VSELRVYQQRMHQERDEAADASEDLATRVSELEVSLARVRSTSKAGLLEQVGQLGATIKALTKRRTLNKRSLEDSCNADKRAATAEQQASAAQATAKAQAARADAADEESARADAAEEKLVKVEAQLTAERKGYWKKLLAERAVHVGMLSAAQKEAAKYKAIAEPPTESFFKDGHYTTKLDLTALEVIATLGVAANVVPELFLIFGRFYGVKIPSRTINVRTGTINGERTYEKRVVLYIPGKTHIKELPAIGGELHNIQVGCWLLEGIDECYCYIADGANSMQQEIYAQLLSRRNTQTGKLESRALSISAISDKSSEGQHAKYKEALEACGEAWEAAAAAGHLDELDTDSTVGDAAQDPEPPPNGEGFHQQRRERELREIIAKRNKLVHLTAASAMNDRAADARKTARLVRNGDGKGGEGDVADDPTCAHH